LYLSGLNCIEIVVAEKLAARGPLKPVSLGEGMSVKVITPTSFVAGSTVLRCICT
jgi:hypothetical protein